MFEQSLPQSDTVPTAAIGAVRRALITGFVSAAVYLALAVYVRSREFGLYAYVALVIGILLLLGSLVAFVGQRSVRSLDRARPIWLVGGFLGLPLGLVMVAMANLMNVAISRAVAAEDSAPLPASVATIPQPASAGVAMSRRLGLICVLLVIGLPVATWWLTREPLPSPLRISAYIGPLGVSLTNREDATLEHCELAVSGGKGWLERGPDGRVWLASVEEDLAVSETVIIPWEQFYDLGPASDALTLTRETAMSLGVKVVCDLKDTSTIRRGVIFRR